MKEDLRKCTIQEALDILADDSDNFMREAVAKNTKTSPKTLAKLAEDEYYKVPIAVAANRSTPPKTLAKLIESKDFYICLEVAWNPSTSKETLAKMIDEECYSWDEVLRAIAQNSNTSLATLRKLAAKGSTTEIREKAREALKRRT